MVWAIKHGKNLTNVVVDFFVTSDLSMKNQHSLKRYCSSKKLISCSSFLEQGLVLLTRQPGFSQWSFYLQLSIHHQEVPSHCLTTRHFCCSPFSCPTFICRPWWVLLETKVVCKKYFSADIGIPYNTAWAKKAKLLISSFVLIFHNLVCTVTIMKLQITRDSLSTLQVMRFHDLHLCTKIKKKQSPQNTLPNGFSQGWNIFLKN